MTPKSLRLAAAIALAAGAVGVSACGSSDSSSDDTSASRPAMTSATTGPADTATTPSATKTAPSEAAATGSAAVRIDDFTFLPPRVTVKVGDEVTWTNDDSSNHTATADDDSFDTANLSAGGASRSISFARAGSFAYHCAFHPTMRGTVVVTE